MKRLKDKYIEERDELLKDAEQIEAADDFTVGYLRHGSACDSGERGKLRMQWVERAKKEFIEENKKAILKRAAESIRKYVEDL